MVKFKFLAKKILNSCVAEACNGTSLKAALIKALVRSAWSTRTHFTASLPEQRQPACAPSPFPRRTRRAERVCARRAACTGLGGRGCWGPCDWCLFGTTFNNRYTAEDARSHWVSNGRSSNSRAEPEDSRPEDAEGAIQIACSNTQKRAKSPRSIKGGISGARAGGAVSGPGLEFRVNS